MRVFIVILLGLAASKVWGHSLDELSLTFRKSDQGIHLRGSISNTLEPLETAALLSLRSEFDNLEISLGGHVCKSNDDFTKIAVEETLESTVATMTYQCPESLQVLRIKPLSPVKWRTSAVLVANENWTTAFIEKDTHEILLQPYGTSLNTFLIFFGEGFKHFAVGLDHVLFLLIVMFGVFLDFQKGKISSSQKTIVQGIKDLTFFTIGHGAAALASAGLGLTLTAQVVEPLIALTIILSALSLSNRFPLKRSHLHYLVLPFGFIHGLSFAYALTDMGLKLDSAWVELISFSLGLELCQILIFVGGLLFLLSRSAKVKEGFSENRLSLAFSLAGFSILASQFL
jgi:hypothetical protein